MRPVSHAKNYQQRFIKNCSFSIWDYIRPSQKDWRKQRKLFLADKVRNPAYSYNKINAGKLFVLLKKLKMLEGLIKKEELRALFKKVYLEKVESKAGEVYLMLALAQQNKKVFQKYARIVFGLPSRYTHYFCKNYFRNAENLKIRHNFAGRIRAIALPTNSVLDNYIKTISEHKVYFERDIKKYFRGALKKIGATKWKVKSDDYGFRLDYKSRAVFIKRLAQITGKRLRGLLAHEIGVHLLRRLGGEKAGEPLLYLGMAGYDRTEESIGCIREMQATKEDINIDLIIVLLAICFALGYEKKQEADFRSTFEYTRSLCAKIYPPRVAAEKAWNICSRIFISPVWHSAGICFAKDHIYVSGIISILNALKRNRKLSAYFDPRYGKIDILNKTHRVFAITALSK